MNAQRKPSEVTQERPRDLLWDAFVKICRIDVDLYGRGRFAKEIQPFRAKGVTPEQVYAWTNWWYAKDWRGRRRETPTMRNIRETWLQAFPVVVDEPVADEPDVPPQSSEVNEFERLETLGEELLSKLHKAEVERLCAEARKLLLESDQGKVYRRWETSVLDAHIRRMVGRELAQRQSGQV